MDALKVSKWRFLSSPNPVLDILGLDLVDKLELLQKPLATFCNQIASSPANNQTKPADTYRTSMALEFPEAFKTTLGTCRPQKAQLRLREGAKPVFRPKRPVPYAIQSAVDAELDRLIEAKIIRPNACSKWAAPIVVVR
jgi:hypothetical protein